MKIFIPYWEIGVSGACVLCLFLHFPHLDSCPSPDAQRSYFKAEASRRGKDKEAHPMGGGPKAALRGALCLDVFPPTISDWTSFSL